MDRIVNQIAFPILLTTLYVYILVFFKAKFYPEWTAMGYLSSLTGLSFLVPFVLIVPYFIFKIYRHNADPQEIAGSYLRDLLTSKQIVLVNVLIFGAICVVAISLRLREEEVYFPKLTYYITGRNWKESQNILTDLRKQPVQEELLETFESYVKIHQLSDSDNFPNGKELRELRNVVERLLNLNYDYKNMNTLSYAELAKVIYFAEDNVEEVTSAVRFLDEKPKSSAILLKQGELFLAIKNYSLAKNKLKMASIVSNDNVEKAVINAKIGNSYAGTENFDSTIIYYRYAEKNYPQIRKHIFYSNFGFVLMQHGQLEEAKEKIALALRIDPTDWYSYLNMGLIYDKQNRNREAINNFQTVIIRADNRDSKREAQIFKGRSMELDKQPEVSYIRTYQLALDKDTTTAEINEIIGSPSLKRELYMSLGMALRQTNTYGIENYIRWFENRVKAE